MDKDKMLTSRDDVSLPEQEYLELDSFYFKQDDEILEDANCWIGLKPCQRKSLTR